MTIAVAAKYPWGELNRLLPLGITVPKAIILATDSRISRKGKNNSYLPPLDVGAKLFQLGRDAAAVYAGTCEVGEQCLAELSRRLPRQKTPIIIQSETIASETFQEMYNNYIAQKRVEPDNLPPLYFLIGTCNAAGQAKLYMFSYAHDFRPEQVSGIQALGYSIEAFKRVFETELRIAVEKELSLRQRCPPQIPMAAMLPMPIKPEHIANFMAYSMKSTIESQTNATVGGMVQCALVTVGGVILLEIAYSTDPTNEGQWTTATSDQNELRTVTGKLGFKKLDT